MTAPVAWSDPTAVGVVRQSVRDNDAAGLKEVARQFESLFLRMMLKSMREASDGDELFDSHEGGMYRDMFDDQIAVDMSGKGSLGLADLLVRQLRQPQAAGGASASEGRQAFVQRLWPLAEDAGRALGIDPRHIVAQAALETGWGKARPAGAAGGDSHNYFGIKAGSGWTGAVVASDTLEFVAGREIVRREPFRAYASVADSVTDYAGLLGQSPRYASVLGTGSDTVAFAKGLQQAGYATDPDYASKLRAVVDAVDAALPSSLKSGNELPIQRATAL
jgi:flagellar protein FlgJ